VALAEYLGHFLPAAKDATPFFTIPVPFVPLIVSPESLTALALITGLTLAHLRGLGPGRLLQNVLAGAKVSALVVFLVLGFSVGRGEVARLAVHAAPGAVTAATLLMALVPVMFTYSGWNAASYVAEEVRSPGKNVPLALGLGTVAVVVIYLGLNALYIYALPIVVRRLLRHAEPELHRRAWEVIKRSLAARLGDQRPLVGLYVCEALEVSLEFIPPEERTELLRFAEAWSEHPVSATRLMAWRLLLGLAMQIGMTLENYVLMHRAQRSAGHENSPQRDRRSLRTGIGERPAPADRDRRSHRRRAVLRRAARRPGGPPDCERPADPRHDLL
jgi:hypothetical protein